jgi:colanic acid biosynthesis glycosyl transferase WcaI
MKVAFFTYAFPPEQTFAASTGAQIAEELTRRGHAVWVLAPFPNHPKGVIFDGYRRTLFSASIIAPGYRLIHCFATLSRTSTMVSRFAANLSFGLTSGLHVLFGERPDLIVTQSWPIFANGIAALVAKLRGIPLVLRIQDCYPESLDSQGRVTNRSWIFRAIRKIDVMTAHSSKQILVISPVFRKLYEEDRGIAPEKLSVIPNWGNDDIVDNDPSPGRAFRAKLGIPEDAFVAVYAGNIGVAARVETLVEAGAKLKHLKRVFIVIAGEGSQLGICRELIKSRQLDRVVIHSPWESEETEALIKMADIALLPTKTTQSLISVPSKLISYLMAARPVVAAVLPESDTADVVFSSGAGWVISPESVDEMAAAIAAASELSKESLNQMGYAGQRFALDHLSKSANLLRVVQTLEAVVGIEEQQGIHEHGATSLQ